MGESERERQTDREKQSESKRERDIDREKKIGLESFRSEKGVCLSYFDTQQS